VDAGSDSVVAEPEAGPLAGPDSPEAEPEVGPLAASVDVGAGAPDQLEYIQHKPSTHNPVSRTMENEATSLDPMYRTYINTHYKANMSKTKIIWKCQYKMSPDK